MNSTKTPSPSPSIINAGSFFTLVVTFCIVHLGFFVTLLCWVQRKQVSFDTGLSMDYSHWIFEVSPVDRTIIQKPLIFLLILLGGLILLDVGTLIISYIHTGDYDKQNRWILLIHFFHIVTIIGIFPTLAFGVTQHYLTLCDYHLHNSRDTYLLYYLPHIAGPCAIILMFYGAHIFIVPMVISENEIITTISMITWGSFLGVTFIYHILKLMVYCLLKFW